MNSQRIDTTCTYEHWKLMKQNNWKPSEVFKAGIGGLMKPDALADRIRELEAQVVALMRRPTRRSSLPMSDEAVAARSQQ